jgi:DNA-binding response OmpR family regulator
MASDRCAGKAAALSLTGLEILVVEDNAAVASAMRSLLEEVGMQVVGVATNVSEADALCSSRPPQIAVVDVQLGRDMAFGLIDRLRRAGVAVLVISGHAAVAEQVTDGAVILQKPFSGSQLLAALHDAIAP